MPHYRMFATMSEKPLPDVPAVKISYHFSNGRVMITPLGTIWVTFWGKHTSDRPRQYNIADDHLSISGNVEGFYCEFDVDCDTYLLTGTITVAKALPFAVSLGRATPTRPQVALAAGQLQLDFQLQVA